MGREKFEYELRGRKFRLITDHKTLENIRGNPTFKKNRINRWIEMIQEFDFQIEYQKPINLIAADSLSRLHEQNNNETDSKIVRAKINKHVIEEDDIECWISDGGMKRVYPKIQDGMQLCINSHVKTGHRGFEGTYYETKQKLYWIGMKRTIERAIKNCETCTKMNRKVKRGYDFIKTTSKMQKVGLYIMELNHNRVLLTIDYHTRYLFGEIIENKSAEQIVNVVKRWCTDHILEEFITDNGKEFVNQYFRKFCYENDIIHHKVSVETHNSNGRIERVIKPLEKVL